MRKPPGKVGVFLEVIHKYWGMSSFSPLRILSLFSSSNKKDLTLPPALINFLSFTALFYWLRCELRSSLGLFEERMVENFCYIYVKKKKNKWARLQNQSCLDILRMGNFCSHPLKTMAQFLNLFNVMCFRLFLVGWNYCFRVNINRKKSVIPKL